jgi:hypothetical protein
MTNNISDQIVTVIEEEGEIVDVKKAGASESTAMTQSEVDEIYGTPHGFKLVGVILYRKSSPG